jgi:hypothetical protein
MSEETGYIDKFNMIEAYLPAMIKFIDKHGMHAFEDAVAEGAFQQISFMYLHASEHLRTTERFEEIQGAFIKAFERDAE